MKRYCKRMMIMGLSVLFIFCSLPLGCVVCDHYYCTACDAQYYPRLKNLIGSIHRHDFEQLGEIAVYDLGLSPAQVHELSMMCKVHVYNLEPTNTEMFKQFVVTKDGKRARGGYSWKPVAIKQALERFPQVLWLDGGATVLKPLGTFFEHIKEHGYFFLGNVHDIHNQWNNHAIKIVRERLLNTKFSHVRDQILAGYDISAGLIGVSRDMLQNFVLPMYEHTRDFSLFTDDGTAPFGFGFCRYDQTIFTMYTYALGLKVNDEGWSMLNVGGKDTPIHIHWNVKCITPDTSIYQSRWNVGYAGGHTRYIRWLEMPGQQAAGRANQPIFLSVHSAH